MRTWLRRSFLALGLASGLLVTALMVLAGSGLVASADAGWGMQAEAGPVDEPAGRQGAGNLAGLGAPLQATGTHTVYFPIVFRRWPPVPYAPQLDAIDKEILDTAYTLTWNILLTGTPVVTMYTVQESGSADLADPLEYTTTMTTYAFSGKHIGLYYYRVRGHNVWGPGEWSNTRSTTVLSLHDDFDYPVPDWTVRRTSSPFLSLATTGYNTGTLWTRLNDRFDFAIYTPMIPAPDPPYRILLLTRIIHQGNEQSYGIVFGGNQGSVCPVDRSLAGTSLGCFWHYYRLNVIWGGYLKAQVKRIDYHTADKGSGRGVELMPTSDVSEWTVHDGWNLWEIRVYPDGFSVYVNDHFFGQSHDTLYLHERYNGIFISNYEYNGAKFEHAFYYIDPLPAGATLGSDAAISSPELWRYPSVSRGGQVE